MRGMEVDRKIGVGEMIIRKVSVVWGRWGKKTDFVLEPVCKKCEKAGEECEVCKDYLYIRIADKNIPRREKGMNYDQFISMETYLNCRSQNMINFIIMAYEERVMHEIAVSKDKDGEGK